MEVLIVQVMQEFMPVKNVYSEKNCRRVSFQTAKIEKKIIYQIKLTVLLDQ